MGFSLRSIRETPERGPFLTLPMAPLKGTLWRGSISPRVSLILSPISMGLLERLMWPEHIGKGCTVLLQ